MREYRKENRIKIREYYRKYYKENKHIVPSLKERYKKSDSWNPKVITSTHYVGRQFELLALRLFPTSKDMNKENPFGGHDIQYKGKNIEVKMRNKNKVGRWGFTFKGCDADLALLFCVENKIIRRIILIPYLGQQTISVNNTSHKSFEITYLKEKLSKQ